MHELTLAAHVKHVQGQLAASPHFDAILSCLAWSLFQVERVDRFPTPSQPASAAKAISAVAHQARKPQTIERLLRGVDIELRVPLCTNRHPPLESVD